MKTWAVIFIGIIVVGCTQDSPLTEGNETQTHLTTQRLAIKDQQVLARYDNQQKGLYQGIFVSAYTQERGKLWVNISNDGVYSAEVVMNDGRMFFFERLLSQEKNDTHKDVFRFVSETNSSFSIDLGDFNRPIITHAELEGSPFFGVVAKKTTTKVPISLTGTFEETGNPAYSGTWSFMADGSNPDPNGSGSTYEGLTGVVITIDGNMYMDEGPFEDTSTGCLGEASPTLSTFALGTQGAITDQVTQFSPASETTWNIEFSKNILQGILYFDAGCSKTPGGTFTTTWQGDVRSGSISVDL